RPKRVAMDLQRVHPILQRVVHPLHQRRKLSRLAHRNEGSPELQRDRGAQYEAATRDPGHVRYSFSGEWLGHRAQRFAEQRRVQKDRRDVLENYPLPGEVGDVPDRTAQLRLELVEGEPRIGARSVHRHSRLAISNGIGSRSAEASASRLTSATAAPSGPLRSSSTSRSTAPSLPSTRTSTLPSASFLTHPASSSRRAARMVNHLKPTPCTTPVTRSR